MKETGVAQSLGKNNIRLIESPLIAKKPVKPSVLKILVLALLAGSVGGIGIVIAFDLTNSSIRTVDQLETVLGLPVLTALPESKRKCLTRESALTSEPGSHEAEAFRSLRTSLSLKALAFGLGKCGQHWQSQNRL